MTYGRLNKRVRAVFFDALVIMGMVVLVSIVLNQFEKTPDSLRLLLFIFVFFLYDPLFTSLFGGTLGHLAMGLRVRNGIDETQKLVFHFALVRFIFKSLLGWISLLTVTGNNKHKAIHDFIVNSVVVEI